MTKLKNETLLTEYAELSEAIKSLEAKKAVIKSKLVTDFEKQGIEKIEHPAGTFSLTSTRTWTYSKDLQKSIENVKIKQIREQEKGIAKASVTTSLRFVAVKE